MPLLPFVGTLQAYLAGWAAEGCALTAVLKGQRCPLAACAGELIGWGSYRRQVKTGGGRTRIRVARRRCKTCRGTCSFLPPFLMPAGQWYLEALAEPIRKRATGGTSAFAAWAWAGGLEMDIGTFYDLGRVAEAMAQGAAANLQSWVAATEPEFRVESVEERHAVKPGRWATVGRWVAILQAVNDFRSLYGRARVSVLGLIHYLSGSSWTTLAVAAT